LARFFLPLWLWDFFPVLSRVVCYVCSRRFVGLRGSCWTHEPGEPPLADLSDFFFFYFSPRFVFLFSVSLYSARSGSLVGKIPARNSLLFPPPFPNNFLFPFSLDVCWAACFRSCWFCRWCCRSRTLPAFFPCSFFFDTPRCLVSSCCRVQLLAPPTVLV